MFNIFAPAGPARVRLNPLALTRGNALALPEDIRRASIFDGLSAAGSALAQSGGFSRTPIDPWQQMALALGAFGQGQRTGARDRLTDSIYSQRLEAEQRKQLMEADQLDARSELFGGPDSRGINWATGRQDAMPGSAGPGMAGPSPRGGAGRYDAAMVDPRRDPEQGFAPSPAAPAGTQAAPAPADQSWRMRAMARAYPDRFGSEALDAMFRQPTAPTTHNFPVGDRLVPHEFDATNRTWRPIPGMGGDRWQRTPGELTPAQERQNAEIQAARDLLTEEGLTAEEIRNRTTRLNPMTGLENPSYSPFLAAQVRTAQKRLYGDDDPEHTEIVARVQGTGKAKGGQPVSAEFKTKKIEQARAALGRGVSRADVDKTLRELGIDPAELR